MKKKSKNRAKRNAPPDPKPKREKKRPSNPRSKTRPAPSLRTEQSPPTEWPTPQTPAELAKWLREVLELEVPQASLIDGHSAPFDYLVHAFFEGRFRRRQRSTGNEEQPITPPAPSQPANEWEQCENPIADCVVWAGRGGGKTFLGAVATLLDLIFKPGIEVRVLGGSMDQSRRMHAHLRRLFDPRRHPALAALVRGSITDKRIRLVNGSEVELLAQSQASVRGTRVQKLRCDEVELFDREVWEAAQLTTRSRLVTTTEGESLEVRGSIECLSTMHVPHGLMRELVDEARTGRRTVFRWGVVDILGPCGPEHACETCVLHTECAGRAKSRDSRLEAPGHLSVRDAVSMKGRVSQLTWNAEMLCVSVKRSDSVLPEFDPAVHVFGHEIDMPGVVVLAGMDFGFRAPTAILWAVHDLAGDLWIVDERIQSGTLLEEHAKALLDGSGRREGHHWPKPSWIGVDPAGRNRNEQTGLSHIQILQQHGLEIKQKRLGVHEGLELVRARLRPAGEGARPRLFVHARCSVLRECLEKYHYPADKPYSLEPSKDGYDHAVDALRYLVQNLDKPVRTTRGEWASMES